MPPSAALPGRLRQQLGRAPGAYVLLFELDGERTTSTGRLGTVTYAEGWYAYVGSAMGGLSGRLGHHLGLHHQRRWHIDHLLPHGRPSAIVTARSSERLECRVAGLLATRLLVFRGFGSSDCRCAGHLLYSQAWTPLVDAALDAVRAAGCQPKMVPLG